MSFDSDQIPDSHRLSFVAKSEGEDFLICENENGELYSVEIDDAIINSFSIPQAKENSITSHSSPSLRVVKEEVIVSVKEVQARLRAGESAQSISADSGWSLEKIEKFSGPIFQERAYIIAQAFKHDIRKTPDELGQKNLLACTNHLLTTHNVDLELSEWNTYLKNDGEWIITLTFPNKNGTLKAQWLFEPNKGTLLAIDEESRWLSGEKDRNKATRPQYGYLSASPQEQTRPTYEYPTTPPKLTAVKTEMRIENTIELDFSSSNEEFSDSEFDENDGIEVLPEEDVEININDESKSNESTPKVKLPSWDEMIFGKKED
jgi:hypothetical protein